MKGLGLGEVSMAFGHRVRISRLLALAVGLAALLMPIGESSAIDYGYDMGGRLATQLYDSGQCAVYTYNANGNRVSQSNITSSPPTWGSGAWGCFGWTP